MSPVCFILCKHANLFEENVSGQWAILFTVFRCIERAFLNLYSFARKSHKMLSSLTF